VRDRPDRAIDGIRVVGVRRGRERADDEQGPHAHVAVLHLGVVTADCRSSDVEPAGIRAIVADGSSVMLRARSIAECRVYIELHACACGDAGLPRYEQLAMTDAGMVATYEGTCLRCGASRTFELLLARELCPPSSFGGERPSTLVDAGEYALVADRRAA